MNSITKLPVSPSANPQLVAELNQNLADALDLKLQVKQAHWNIKGTNFIALHKLFDEVAAAVDEYADLLAERVVQLGGIAYGTSQAIHKASRLKAYPLDIQASELHVKQLTESLRLFADNVRGLIDQSGELGDQVTADICTEVSRETDKWRWMVEANL
ncbi:MAG: DNA starvation/stationary phase protection protein Dps [Gammaproteobacteria bacterium]